MLTSSNHDEEEEINQLIEEEKAHLKIFRLTLTYRLNTDEPKMIFGVKCHF